AVDGHFLVNAQQVIYGKTTLDNLASETSLKSGVMKIVSLTANLGQGDVALAADVDSAANPSNIEARCRANGVDGVPLMDVMGLGGAVTAGKLNIEAQVA